MTREFITQDKQVIKLFREYVKVYADHNKSVGYKKLKKMFDKVSELQTKNQELDKQFQENTKEAQLLQTSEEFTKLFAEHKKIQGKIIDLKQKLASTIVIEDRGEFEEIQNVITDKKGNIKVIVVDLLKRNTEDFMEDYRKKKTIK